LSHEKNNQYISGGGGFSHPQFFTISAAHTVGLTRSDIVAGRQPERVVTADFNGDGILDLAAADSPNNEVLIFLGNGNGTFQSRLRWPPAAVPQIWWLPISTMTTNWTWPPSTTRGTQFPFS
jgi:FG-GAP-like repeat